MSLPNTWTLDDIRHDLAEELSLIHRHNIHFRHIYGERHDEVFYKTVADYIRELGHNRYERPERKEKQRLLLRVTR
jgi:hypothetical protein